MRLILLIFLHLAMSTAYVHAYVSSSTTPAGSNETDYLALMAFKSTISDDPLRVLSSWNHSRHFCSWEGVTCGRLHRRVTVLDLQSRGLAGTLSPHLGNMSFLRNLWLTNNSLQGVIPPELGRVFRLQELLLDRNHLGGGIPPTISNCSNLKLLKLSHNKLVGEIPTQLGSLAKLTSLFLHVNNLTGGVPPAIGNLTSLDTLGVTYNCLTGTISDNIGQLKNLTGLYLGGNQLHGIIPPSLYNLSRLTIVSLSENKLEGNFSPGLGNLLLPQVKYLMLASNRLTGSVPYALSNASELVDLDLTYNSLSGKIETSFGSLRNLQGLSMGGNSLGSGEFDEMNFLSSLANCTGLQAVELANNQLRGALPRVVHNFSSELFYFSLRFNQIYGNLPSWIGDLIGMTQLYLDHNEIVGPVPPFLGKLHKLQRLTLDSNRLSGEIPATIGNLTLLTDLTLNDNELQGIVPPSLGNCQRLLLLDLSQNELSDIIPLPLFNISTLSNMLNLSHNNFSGSLPSEVGNLRKLSSLDVSDNSLSAEIPDSIGSCTSLVYLAMEGNFFRGSIPGSFSALRGLETLDLSRNNLSGQIPKFLEKFSLTNLNLSYNDFEGEVPRGGIFSNASSISVANNSRLCGGIIQLELPKCIFPSRSYKSKNSILHLILAITIPCTVLGIIVATAFLYSRLRKMKSMKPSATLLKEPLLSVSYEMLLNATDGFSSVNLIGAGSFGYVYKGVLAPEERVVAVKVLRLSHPKALRSFLAECEALRNIRHRNIVKVLTSCSSIDFQGNDFKAIVYDYMPNGSVERWLHSSQEAADEQGELRTLNLKQKVSIATDVAHALSYMHNDCESPIIHCDLKPSNILLDQDMVAHIGDFGLARFLDRDISDSNQSASLGLIGTIGYAAPEYGMGSDVSPKGDVYSFGIFLLELMTEKRPTDPMFHEGLTLREYASAALDNEDENDDGAINNDAINDSFIRMIKLGIACSMESPHDRMDITDAARELDSITRSFN